MVNPPLDAAPATVGGRLPEPADVVRPGERVALFVDALQTLHAARLAARFRPDWQRVREHFLAAGEAAGAYLYFADTGEPGDPSRFDKYARWGYVLRVKPVRRVHAGDVLVKQKANFSVEVTLDMLHQADRYDVAFLFSGDGNFRPLLEVLRARGKRVHVVATRATLSEDLLHAADKPVFHMEDLRPALE